MQAATPCAALWLGAVASLPAQVQVRAGQIRVSSRACHQLGVSSSRCSSARARQSCLVMTARVCATQGHLGLGLLWSRGGCDWTRLVSQGSSVMPYLLQHYILLLSLQCHKSQQYIVQVHLHPGCGGHQA